MSEGGLLSSLLSLAEEVGLDVRFVRGCGSSEEHPGGAVVRIKGATVVFLDPTANPSDRRSVLVRALAGRPELADRYLPPEVRDALEGDEEF